MKNLIVANLNKNNPRWAKERLVSYIKAQVHNSIDLGWDPRDLILIVNFDDIFMGVNSINVSLNGFCFTGSKVFAVKWVMDNKITEDVIWAHDLDAWQNVEFECPDFAEVGISQYSNRKFNGGSIFWKTSSKDILDEIVSAIIGDQSVKEEPTLNKILKQKKLRKRVTVLDRTYNVGCSGFAKRFDICEKPIRVCHFHPDRGTAWEIHGLGRCGQDRVSVSPRLERILRKYFNLAMELSDKGKRFKP